MSYTYQYPRPAVTVDAVVFNLQEEKLYLLLIKRKQEPFAGQWALPGGFLDIDETPETAVKRELKEETGIEVDKFVQVGAFGDPDRDPRHRTISIAFLSILKGGLPDALGADDAEEAKWFPVEALPAAMAFDHGNIIQHSKTRLGVQLKMAEIASEEAFGLNGSEIKKVVEQFDKIN